MVDDLLLSRQLLCEHTAVTAGGLNNSVFAEMHSNQTPNYKVHVFAELLNEISRCVICDKNAKQMFSCDSSVQSDG